MKKLRNDNIAKSPSLSSGDFALLVRTRPSEKTKTLFIAYYANLANLSSSDGYNEFFANVLIRDAQLCYVVNDAHSFALEHHINTRLVNQALNIIGMFCNGLIFDTISNFEILYVFIKLLKDQVAEGMIEE